MLWDCLVPGMWSYVMHLHFILGFSRKQASLVHFGPKAGKFENYAKKTRQEPCYWPASYRAVACFWVETGQVYLNLSILSTGLSGHIH